MGCARGIPHLRARGRGALARWIIVRTLMCDWHRCTGVLACLDGYMNIAMEQTEEYVNGQLKAKYGDAFIRGNNGARPLRMWHVAITALLTFSRAAPPWTGAMRGQSCTLAPRRRREHSSICAERHRRHTRCANTLAGHDVRSRRRPHLSSCASWLSTTIHTHPLRICVPRGPSWILAARAARELRRRGEGDSTVDMLLRRSEGL